MSSDARATIVTIDGDGVGPEVVRAARGVLERAVAVAYGGKRALAWKPVDGGSAESGLSAETLSAIETHRAVLRGPWTRAASRSSQLARRFDLFVASMHLPREDGEALLLAECGEGAAMPAELVPGSLEANGVLGAIKRALPKVSPQLRFGSRERVESYLRSVGRREMPLVETGLAIELWTREGSERLVREAVARASAEKRHRVTVVSDRAAQPSASSALADWAFRTALLANPDALVEPDLRRAEVRAGADAAAEIRDRALAEGLFVEARAFAEACEDAWKLARTLDVVVAPWSEAALLAGVLAARRGGATTVGLVKDGASGVRIAETLHGCAPALAGKDRANPTGAIRAGAELLRALGWHEAAGVVENALKRAWDAGHRTEDARGSGDAAPALGCAAFAEAVAGLLAR